MKVRIKLILVGDNPFQGVSHVSRERALQRDEKISDARFAAWLVITSVANGANGFTFTVNETTLAILNEISKIKSADIALYPLVPDAGEMVRVAGSAGGIPGLAKEMVRRMVFCVDRHLLLDLVKGALLNKPESLFRSYLIYEYRRLHNLIGQGNKRLLKSILLHEIVTDMALALNMEWLFRAHVESMASLRLRPGFQTRNLPYLVKRFHQWHLEPADMVIEAPFNAIGFQMCPSRADCERALEYVKDAEVIAISVLAAGYLKPPKAFEYALTLKGLGGIAVGVSSENQAISTFSLVKRVFSQAYISNLGEEPKQEEVAE